MPICHQHMVGPWRSLWNAIYRENLTRWQIPVRCWAFTVLRSRPTCSHAQIQLVFIDLQQKDTVKRNWERFSLAVNIYSWTLHACFWIWIPTFYPRDQSIFSSYSFMHQCKGSSLVCLNARNPPGRIQRRSPPCITPHMVRQQRGSFDIKKHPSHVSAYEAVFTASKFNQRLCDPI